MQYNDNYVTNITVLFGDKVTEIPLANKIIILVSHFSIMDIVCG